MVECQLFSASMTSDVSRFFSALVEREECMTTHQEIILYIYMYICNSEPKHKKIIGKYRPIVFVSILLQSLEGGDFKISVQGAGKMS